MSRSKPAEFSGRVEQAADAILKAKGSAGPLELMLQLGWLAPSHFQRWQKGIIPTLLDLMQVSPEKRGKAFRHFEQWARDRRLKPVQIPYIRSTPGGEVPLTISPGNDPITEQFFQTHYIPEDLPEKKTGRTVAKLSKPQDIVVFETVSHSVICTGCETELGKGDFLFMEKGQPLCLTCADLDTLEYLPRGDAALTRRARKYSRLSAVVVRFSRTRGRYERQGLLVEPDAIEKAEKECLNDEDLRMARREREAEKRAAQDQDLVIEMAKSIRRMYPGCPADEAERIAAHTAERGSGRVGRSAAGRNLEDHALELAVAAWIRHQKTNYDELLNSGCDRFEAREMIRDRIQEVIDRWEAE